jgi:hypothetical protein
MVPANAASLDSIRRIESILRVNSGNSDYRVYAGIRWYTLVYLKKLVFLLYRCISISRVYFLSLLL